MSKPLTKGRCVGMRLDLDDDALLRWTADHQDTTPGLLAAEIVTRWAKEHRALPRPRQEVTIDDVRDRIARSSQDRREQEEVDA